MNSRSQFAGWLMALGLSIGVALPCAAQRPRNDRPPRAQQRQERRQERPAQRPQQRTEGRGPFNQGQNAPATHAPNSPNRPTGPANSLAGGNRPPNTVFRPRDLTPEERRRMRDYNQRFSRLTPQQQQDMRERAQVWNRLTQEQQNHIRNDVLPKWQQLPPNRRRAIENRLDVLQNMPEWARNQHLNDPNFTRGMSEEDKAMLRDLSHMHVGGPPDPPNE